MLKFQMPSQTSLNQPTCLPRIPKSELECCCDRWYWRGQLFDGYLYDVTDQRRVEIWRVQAGQMINRHVQPELMDCCNAYQMHNPPMIDITGFNLDDYNGITSWQTFPHPYYQHGMTFDGSRLIVDGLPFNGISVYSHRQIIRDEEVWLDGYIVSSIRWWEIDDAFKICSLSIQHPYSLWGVSYSSQCSVRIYTLKSQEESVLGSDVKSNYSITLRYHEGKVRIFSLDITADACIDKLREIIDFEKDRVFDYDFKDSIYLRGDGITSQTIDAFRLSNRFAHTEKIDISETVYTTELFISLANISTLKILDLSSRSLEKSPDLIEHFSKLRPDVEIVLSY